MIKIIPKRLFFFLINRFRLNQFENLIRDSFWSVLGTFLSRAVMLVSSILLARILNQVEYGQLGLLRSTLNFFVVFAGFGLGNTTSRYVALNRKDNIGEARRIFDISIIFTFFLALVITTMVYVFAREISQLSFNDVSLYKYLRISSFLLFFAAMNGVIGGGLAGFQDFKSIAKNNLLSSIIQSIFSLIGAFYFGVTGSLVGFGAGYIYLYLLNKKAVNKCFGYGRACVSFFSFFSEKKDFLYSFSLPAALSSFLVTPVFWWAKAFMIRYTSFKEMAFFDVADQWRLVVLFVPSALMQLFLPALTISSKNDFQQTLNFNIKMNLFCTLLTAVPVILLSKFILSLYGDAYMSIELFIVVISSCLFSSFCSVIGLALASKGKMWISFMFNLSWALYFVLFTIYFVKNNYGATGLGYAVFMSYFLQGLSQFIYFKIKNL